MATPRIISHLTFILYTPTISGLVGEIDKKWDTTDFQITI